MINLSFSFPSSTPDAVIDLKKGRSTISLSMADLSLVSNLLTLLSMNGVSDINSNGETQTPSGSTDKVIPIDSANNQGPAAA